MSRRPLLVLLAIACVLAALLGLSAGPSGWLPPWRASEIVLDLRAPRVALAAVVGAALAVAGVAMQALLQNDLADPYVLGLSGGASAGAVASLVFLPGLAPSPAAAAGAAGAALLVRFLARGPYDRTRLLLAGFAVSSVLASITGLILVLAPESRVLRGTVYWLFGGLGTPRWSALVLPAALSLAVFAWMLSRAERLDRLTLGEDVARSLGVRVAGLRRELLCAAVGLTAAVVSIGGLVGFVGLMAPHFARRGAGTSHRRLLPIAALSGALLVMAADTLARTAFAPREVPVGLVTAAVGGPLLLWQLQWRPA